MMFCPVVGSVVGSWAPVLLPWESRQWSHCLGALWLDVVGDHAMCCAVVSLDGCGRLLVAHLFENMLQGDCFTGVDVEGT